MKARLNDLTNIGTVALFKFIIELTPKTIELHRSL